MVALRDLPAKTQATIQEVRKSLTVRCPHCDLPDPQHNPYCFCRPLKEGTMLEYIVIVFIINLSLNMMGVFQ